MVGATFVEELALALMLVAQASGAEPEETLEALPRVIEVVEGRLKKEQPGYVGFVDPWESK